jgi:hypothetical protein
MVSFSSRENLQELTGKLEQISPNLAGQVEIEELILYPHVVKRLQKYGLRPVSGHAPSKVPKEQV